MGLCEQLTLRGIRRDITASEYLVALLLGSTVVLAVAATFGAAR